MAYYRNNPGGPDNESEQFCEIFAEFDFGYDDHECNFFCPECRNILKCEAYREVRESWDSFYM